MKSPFPCSRSIALLAFGVLLFTTAFASADTYAQWKARVFTTVEQGNAAVSAESAIPAGDGITNLEKFAFDLDPHQNGRAGLPAVSAVIDYNNVSERNDSYLAITYRVPSGYSPENITCIPEVSPNLQAGSWMRGSLVISYFDYQSGPQPGDPSLYTFKVLSPMSQNPGGLFMRVRVVDGHQLPADWQQKYFPESSVTADSDADLDGLTNWDEFVDGTDPTDFYNATPPELFLVGGGNQRATAGSLLAQPISVMVNYYGDENAPLVFTATGGALLAPDGGGSYTPSATINVRATGQINVNGSQTHVGQACVYLPNTSSTVSTITATATTSGQSVSVSTTAIAGDPNIQPPADFALAFNTDKYAALTFTPSDLSLPVSIEVSTDEGVTWSTWGVAAPGMTSFDLRGSGHMLIRAFTGADPSDGGDGANLNGAQLNVTMPPTPTSPPTATIEATIYPEPTPFFDNRSIYQVNWSYAGFQNVSRYLHLRADFTIGAPPTVDYMFHYEEDRPPLRAPGGSFILEDPKNHGVPYPGQFVRGFAASDTQWHGILSDWRDANQQPVANGTYKYLLSKPYTINQFKSDVAATWPGFLNNFSTYHSAYRNRAGLTLYGPWPGLDMTTQCNLSYNYGYTVEKLQYYFDVNKNPNGHVDWDEVFFPQGGGDALHNVRHCDTHGATRTATFTIDPWTQNDKADGIYHVLLPLLLPYGHADDSVYDGDSVPSNKTDGTGGRHFVTPKAAGGFVTIEPRGATGELEGKDLSTMYEPVVLLDGTDVTATKATKSATRLFVKTDDPNHYLVQLRAKNAAKTIIDTLNVWVVSTTLTADITSGHTSAIDGTPLGNSSGRRIILRNPDGSIAEAGYQPTTGIDWKIEIQPPTIITDADRPAFEKQTRVAPPGGAAENVGVAGPGNPDASGSVFSGWDASRQRQTRVAHGPSLTPTDASSGAYKPMDFPTSDTEGNDDLDVLFDEDSDPYNARRGTVGQLIANDKTDFLHYDSRDALQQGGVGVDGDKLQFRTKFREFVRVQIGDKWYRCSESTDGLWRFFFDIQRTNGRWNLVPGTSIAFDLTNND